MRLPCLPGRRVLSTKYGSRILLLSVTILCVLFAVEIALRVIEPHESTYEWIIQRPATRRLYEPLPSSSGVLLGQTIRINSIGIRDEELRKTKESGTFRIIGLGDSITMAPGVKREDSYLERLESLLNSDSSATKFQVLNFGVWGYNTVQEVDFFEAKGLELAPDLVLLGFFPNDASETELLRDEPRGLPDYLNQSLLIRFAKPRLAALGRALNLPLRTYVSGLMDLYDDESPGWRDCQESIRRLKVLGRQNGFTLVVVIIPLPVSFDRGYPLQPVHEKVREFCLSEDLPFWDALTAFEGTYAPSVWVGLTDAHFNSRGHNILANFLHNRLRSLINRTSSASTAPESGSLAGSGSEGFDDPSK